MELLDELAQSLRLPDFIVRGYIHEPNTTKRFKIESMMDAKTFWNKVNGVLYYLQIGIAVPGLPTVIQSIIYDYGDWETMYGLLSYVRRYTLHVLKQFGSKHHFYRFRNGECVDASPRIITTDAGTYLVRFHNIDKKLSACIIYVRHGVSPEVSAWKASVFNSTSGQPKLIYGHENNALGRKSFNSILACYSCGTWYTTVQEVEYVDIENQGPY